MAIATGSNCGCCSMQTLSAQQESDADDDQHNGENPLQQTAVQLVCQFCADAGEKHTGGYDTDQREQIDEAETQFRQVGVLPAGPDIGGGAGHSDGQA